MLIKHIAAYNACLDELKQEDWTVFSAGLLYYRVRTTQHLMCLLFFFKWIESVSDDVMDSFNLNTTRKALGGCRPPPSSSFHPTILLITWNTFSEFAIIYCSSCIRLSERMLICWGGSNCDSWEETELCRQQMWTNDYQQRPNSRWPCRLIYIPHPFFILSFALHNSHRCSSSKHLQFTFDSLCFSSRLSRTKESVGIITFQWDKNTMFLE